MKTSLNKEIIGNMINNSTWVSGENKTTFRFSGGKVLTINGKNNLQYSLSHEGRRIAIQIGAEKSYYIDYINDFALCLYNNHEKFRITPE